MRQPTVTIDLQRTEGCVLGRKSAACRCYRETIYTQVLSNFPRWSNQIMDISTLPFNKAIGIIADGSGVRLVPTREHLNHLETVHATVLYGIAEAASGQFLIKRFPNLADSLFAVLRTSTVKYRRPASISSDISGKAHASDDNVAAFEAALQTRGRSTIEIDVSVTQGEIELFTGVFRWYAAHR